ncbi:hypothetical protein C8E87_0369 [Paractinoplanes brasiliensis]|uniref:Uncharacterized protein n=1 Tax=Paractinoplanes brasiliensis TaxID=52695 RepID=A0A4R6JLT4_9ACTN|nr:hypothetical protein C8E87_0369 [Actinoplanes brasiliensis]
MPHVIDLVNRLTSMQIHIIWMSELTVIPGPRKVRIPAAAICPDSSAVALGPSRAAFR